MRISTQAEDGETSESDLEIEEHLDSGDSDCDSPPPRKWTGAVSPTEDSIMEEFVLFCSNRFVTWGSVMAAKTHVVEFMRSMFGAVPPPFPCTDYTLSKLKKLMAKERPAGRRTRTGFTVPEVTDVPLALCLKSRYPLW